MMVWFYVTNAKLSKMNTIHDPASLFLTLWYNKVILIVTIRSEKD